MLEQSGKKCNLFSRELSPGKKQMSETSNRYPRAAITVALRWVSGNLFKTNDDIGYNERNKN